MDEVKKPTSMVKKVKSLPVVDVSLIVSVITLILAFIAGIIYFIIGWATIYQITTYLIALKPESAATVNSIAASITGMGAIYLIILWPIMVFIGTFIITAIVILLYNYLAPKIGYIKLELE